MSSYPTISLITPTFRCGHLLEQTLDSVLSQGYPNLQYVVMDGGSNDNTGEILGRHAKHLHFWTSEPDRGQYDAINRGFTHTTGEIMGWLNADDMHFPWTLRTVGSIFAQLPEVEWITTLQPGFWDHEGFCLGFEAIRGFSREAFIDGCYLDGNHPFFGYLQQESTFWRRSLWERAGSQIPSEYPLGGDFALWCRFCLHAEIHAVPSPLAGFRFNRAQRSTERERYRSECLRALQQLQAARPSDRTGPTQPPGARNYTGQRIVREHRDSDAARWIVERYDFG